MAGIADCITSHDLGWCIDWRLLSLAILIKGEVHEALLKEDVIVIQGIIVKQVALKAG